jgi:hypothetical protein
MVAVGVSTQTSKAVATVGPAGAGAVNLTNNAASSFDKYDKSPTATQEQWIVNHYTRMLTYAPYFDSRTSWYGNAWSYRDTYAIYVGSALASQHPDWILKDAHGNFLYIPWGCGGGTCPQYAADAGNPAYRAYYVSQAQQDIANGYRGIFMDDMNMNLDVGDGSGNSVDPTDPRTGAPMTNTAWQQNMAGLAVAVRQALPSAEIVHNALWFNGDSSPYIQEELKAANVIELERGVVDGGINSGNGTFGYETLMSFVDYLHSNGVHVNFAAYSSTLPQTIYNLASYFLVSTGGDYAGSNYRSLPDSWWSGYGVQLGAPLGGRYSWNGLLRRDFQGGMVLVNEPGAPTRTVTLPGTFTDLASGSSVSSVSVGSSSGSILVSSSAATPAPTSTPTPTTTPTPSHSTSPTPTARPTATPTPTPTARPTATPVPTPTPPSGHTFGKTRVGANTSSFSADWKRVNKYTLSVNATVNKLSIYLQPGHNRGTQTVEGVIYANANGVPGALLAHTQPLTFSTGESAGWYDLKLSTPLSLRAGDYWLGVFTGGNADVAAFRYDPVSNVRYWNTNTFSAGPSSWFGSGTWDNYSMSIYAGYTTGGAFTPTPCPPTVEYGSVNHTVALLQTVLDAHGYHLVVDGNDGPLTTAAVKDFQSRHGTQADGIVGAVTWHLLGQC